MIHHNLKGRWYISKPKGYDKELVMIKIYFEGYLQNICGVNVNLVIFQS